MTAERRLFPRKPVNVPVQVVVPDGAEERAYHATMDTLSKNGTQLSCNRELVLSLLEQEEYPPTCQLTFSLPGDKASIDVEIRMVVNRRIAADHHSLGFSFVSFKDGGEAAVSNYLDGAW